MMFFIGCICLVIMAGMAVRAWKGKAVILILIVAGSALCVYRLPLYLNQWKFAQLKEKEQWKIVCSPRLPPQALFELRFLGFNREILQEKNRGFRNPSLSKDGLRVVFTITEGPERENRGMGIVGTDGNGFLPIALNGLKPEGTAWSPDGRYIAFWAGRNADTESMDLYLFDLHTSRTRRLLQKATFYGTHYPLSWSPDSWKLVFASLDDFISIIDIRTGNVVRLTKGNAPSWSPDGSTIIYREGVPFSRHHHDRITYYAMAPDGTGKRFIFDGGPGRWDDGYVTGPVVWSPDGRHILFLKTYDPLFDTDITKIYILDRVENRKYLVDKKKYIQSCTWGQGK